jgi:hypothetical protein
VVIDHQAGDWPGLSGWRELLPSWFVEACPEQSPSTREQAGKTAPSARARPATSTTETRGTTEILSLFDQLDGTAPYT